MRNWFYSRTCHRLPRILKAVTTVLSSGLSKSQVCLPLITVILASIQWSPLWSDKIYLIPPKGSVIFLSRLIPLPSHWNWHVIPVISFAPPPTFPPQGIKNDQSLKLQYVLRFTRTGFVIVVKIRDTASWLVHLCYCFSIQLTCVWNIHKFLEYSHGVLEVMVSIF